MGIKFTYASLHPQRYCVHFASTSTLNIFALHITALHHSKSLNVCIYSLDRKLVLPV